MNNYKNYIIIGLLAVIAVLVLVFVPKQNSPDNGLGGNGGNNGGEDVEVTDFHTCSEAGYPILESSPMQCRTPDGRVFVEDLSEDAEVVIETPTRGQLVKSPLTISGKAKGTWFFEANLPVTLKDQNGKVLAQKGAQAQGEWMTENYVNFTVVLEFEQPTTEFGLLLIQKDNPSGLPQNDAEYAIPVTFR